jgi:hypothetical protein
MKKKKRRQLMVKMGIIKRKEIKWRIKPPPKVVKVAFTSAQPIKVKVWNGKLFLLLA